MTIDASRDALVAVDVQNDFCPGGALGVPDGDQVIPVLNRYAERFRAVGARVYLTRDWHPAVTRHFQAQGGLWPPHCVAGTRGAEFHPDLAIPPAAVVVSKGMEPGQDGYSCFQAETSEGTPFRTVLRRAGIERLWIGGLATDYCVKVSVGDALREGFQVVVLEDAIRAVDLEPGDGERAIAEMRKGGARFVSLADV